MKLPRPPPVSLVTVASLLLLLLVGRGQSQNGTEWDPLYATSKPVPCLQGCSCHTEPETLSIVCLSGDQPKAGDNAVNEPSSAPFNGTVKPETNNSISTTARPVSGTESSHTAANLTHFLVNVSVVYVEGFRGQATALGDFLSGAPRSIEEIYLKNSSITVTSRWGEAPVTTSPGLENPSANSSELPDLAPINPHITSLLFRVAPNLRAIAITAGNISVITADTFDGACHLKTINLSGNMISVLNDGFLANQTSLERLNLSRNWLLMANLGCSQPLISLKALDVSFNWIRNVGGVYCEGGVPLLETLDMSHNQIEMLEEGSFDELGYLQVLDLSSNLISQINTGAFGCSLIVLHTLSLQNNSVTSLNLQVLAPLKRLFQFKASQNQIGLITTDTAYNHTNGSVCEESPLPELQLIDSVPFLPAVRNPWPHLELIDVSHNNLSALPQPVFEEFFKNSRQLDLSHNRINYVPRYGVENLKALESIDFSHNLIDWMDVGTFTSPNLRDIDLSHNRLKKVISMTFLYLPNLRRLDMSHNRLNYLYRLALYKTCKNGQRIHLDLTHNRLSEDAIWKFMSTFHEMKNENCLLAMDFQNNHLRFLLDAASRQNFIRALHEESPQFYHMWSHSLFNMSHNPFHCDCHLHQDISLIMQINREVIANGGNSHSLFRWDNLLCEKPSNFKGLSFAQAESALATACEVDVLEDLSQIDTDCNGASSSHLRQNGRQIPCNRKEDADHHFLVAAVIASIGTLAGFITVVFVFKKLDVIHCLAGRVRWYRVYAEEHHGNQSVALYYHSSDRSLVMNELVYFVQDCCPNHDIVLHPSDDINEQMDQPASTFPKTTLFIISSELVQAIRGSRETQAHYEAVIEQSQASVFLVMGNRGELEVQYPHFWSKVKYRHNVYFVCGKDRLPKLQCVLSNVCGGEQTGPY